MNIYEYLQYIQEGSSKIKLIPLDRQFHSSVDIPEKYDVKEFFDNPKATFYTAVMNGKKIATVGFVKYANNYFQIAIHQDYRGKGLVKDLSDTLVKKHKILKLHATIMKTNIASMKAHKKAGFRELTKEEYGLYRKNRWLSRTGHVVYVKEYK